MALLSVCNDRGLNISLNNSNIVIIVIFRKIYRTLQKTTNIVSMMQNQEGHLPHQFEIKINIPYLGPKFLSVISLKTKTFKSLLPNTL